jgi:hypothetical protein
MDILNYQRENKQFIENFEKTISFPGKYGTTLLKFK